MADTKDIKGVIKGLFEMHAAGLDRAMMHARDHGGDVAALRLLQLQLAGVQSHAEMQTSVSAFHHECVRMEPTVQLAVA